MQIFKSRFKPVFLSLMFILNSIICHSAWANSIRIFSLNADQWARPRAGQVIPQMEPVRLALAYWESGTDASILLSHAGEDSGQIWAAELKDWMVSLGIPSDYILLSPGLVKEDEIRILVGSRQEMIK